MNDPDPPTFIPIGRASAPVVAMASIAFDRATPARMTEAEARRIVANPGAHAHRPALLSICWAIVRGGHEQRRTAQGLTLPQVSA